MAIADGVAQGVVIMRGHSGSRHVSIRAIRLGFCIVALASCLAIARLVSVDSVAQRSILSPASEAARIKFEASESNTHREDVAMQAETLRTALRGMRSESSPQARLMLSHADDLLRKGAEGGTSAGIAALQAARAVLSQVVGKEVEQDQHVAGRSSLDNPARMQSLTSDQLSVPDSQVAWRERYMERYASCWPHCAPQANILSTIDPTEYPFNEEAGGHKWTAWKIGHSGISAAYAQAEKKYYDEGKRVREAERADQLYPNTLGQAYKAPGDVSSTSLLGHAPPARNFETRTAYDRRINREWRRKAHPYTPLQEGTGGAFSENGEESRASLRQAEKEFEAHAVQSAEPAVSEVRRQQTYMWPHVASAASYPRAEADNAGAAEGEYVNQRLQAGQPSPQTESPGEYVWTGNGGKSELNVYSTDFLRRASDNYYGANSGHAWAWRDDSDKKNGYYYNVLADPKDNVFNSDPYHGDPLRDPSPQNASIYGFTGLSGSLQRLHQLAIKKIARKSVTLQAPAAALQASARYYNEPNARDEWEDHWKDPSGGVQTAIAAQQRKEALQKVLRGERASGVVAPAVDYQHIQQQLLEREREVERENEALRRQVILYRQSLEQQHARHRRQQQLDVPDASKQIGPLNHAGINMGNDMIGPGDDVMTNVPGGISVGQIFKANKAQEMLQQAGDRQSADARDQKIGRLTQVGVQLKKILNTLKSGDINRSEQQLAGAEARNESGPSNHVGINMGINMGSDMIGPGDDVMTKAPGGISVGQIFKANKAQAMLQQVEDRGSSPTQELAGVSSLTSVTIPSYTASVTIPTYTVTSTSSTPKQYYATGIGAPVNTPPQLPPLSFVSAPMGGSASVTLPVYRRTPQNPWVEQPTKMSASERAKLSAQSATEAAIWAVKASSGITVAGSPSVDTKAAEAEGTAAGAEAAAAGANATLAGASSTAAATKAVEGLAKAGLVATLRHTAQLSLNRRADEAHTGERLVYTLGAKREQKRSSAPAAMKAIAAIQTEEMKVAGFMAEQEASRLSHRPPLPITDAGADTFVLSVPSTEKAALKDDQLKGGGKGDDFSLKGIAASKLRAVWDKASLAL